MTEPHPPRVRLLPQQHDLSLSFLIAPHFVLLLACRRAEQLFDMLFNHISNYINNIITISSHLQLARIHNLSL